MAQTKQQAASRKQAAATRRETTARKNARKSTRAYNGRRIRAQRRAYDQALELVEKRREQLQAAIQAEWEETDVTLRVLAEDSKFVFGRVGQIVRGEG